MRSLARAESREALRGFEGTAARDYFAAWRHITPGDIPTWEGRSRRPPRDPLNACLSFAYSMLAKDMFSACMIAGLDPYFGFYHADRFGGRALRSTSWNPSARQSPTASFWTLLNNARLTKSDFVTRADSCYLTDKGRKRFYAAYEERLATEARHPVFAYRLSYRRALELEARYLAGFIRGDFENWKPFRAR